MSPEIRTQTKPPPRAFTLVEVLVALTIFACGIIGLLGAFSVSTRSIASADRREQAARIAQRELAMTRVTPAEALEEREGVEGGFSWRVELRAKPMELMQASVRVQWLDRGRLETFQLSQVFLPRRNTQ